MMDSDSPADAASTRIKGKAIPTTKHRRFQSLELQPLQTEGLNANDLGARTSSTDAGLGSNSGSSSGDGDWLSAAGGASTAAHSRLKVCEFLRHQPPAQCDEHSVLRGFCSDASNSREANQSGGT